jgi:AbrB family looped-hinge helix DNA binding protein
MTEVTGMVGGKDMAATWIRDKGQVTLPKEIRKAAHLEPGDPVMVELVEGGIMIRPQKMVDASQAWFWTPEWQEGERRASADIADGRTEVFKTDEEFLASFDT